MLPYTVYRSNSRKCLAMDYLKKLIGEIEIHSVEGIIECFENGVNPNDYFNGEPLIYELTSEYLRSDKV